MSKVRVTVACPRCDEPMAVIYWKFKATRIDPAGEDYAFKHTCAGAEEYSDDETALFYVRLDDALAEYYEREARWESGPLTKAERVAERRAANPERESRRQQELTRMRSPVRTCFNAGVLR